MSAWRDSPLAGSRRGLSRHSLAGAIAVLALIGIGAAVALALRGGSARHGGGLAHVRRPASRAPALATPSVSGPRATSGEGAGGARAHSSHAVHSGASAGASADSRGRAHAAAGAAGGAHQVVIAGPGGTSVAVTPDPEESKSFPAPANVRHSSATTPAAAGEALVAPGAPSDAEVRRELARMHTVEAAARRQAAVSEATVPGGDSVGGNGTIPIPQGVPLTVQRVIAGGNAIADFPYVFGGGHASFVDNAYDCSGSVSYALAAGGLIGAPETSGELERCGAPGPGRWITVYANAGHTYMYVNIGSGWMRFDTVGRSGEFASRWQPQIRSNEGFVARHPPGL